MFKLLYIVPAEYFMPLKYLSQTLGKILYYWVNNKLKLAVSNYELKLYSDKEISNKIKAGETLKNKQILKIDSTMHTINLGHTYL